MCPRNFVGNSSSRELCGTLSARRVVARPLVWAIAAIAISVLASDTTAYAQKSKRGRVAAAPDSGIHDYRSAHFLIHSDLNAKEAAELLRQLETVDKLIATYWGRPPSGVLECYIAKDFSSWSEEEVAKMDPHGAAKIREGAGVCICQVMSQGDRFQAKARMYSVAKDGVPLHEAVHGYCGQTFGRTGPKWYAEGMAELGHYWVNGRKGVNAPEVVIHFLKESESRKLESLINLEQSTGGTWQDYAWWWFLCHLLENNPNYSAQFRALGPELLAGKDTGFRQVFSTHIHELEFEYQFFLRHLEAGYRVDLCAWDWKKKSPPTTSPSRTIIANIQAGRGWQPLGLTVSAGTSYAYSASGTWKPGKDVELVGADGADNGCGRLVGVVMKDHQLGEEFPLGESGIFKAPTNGVLYLRCRNPWNQLANATGRLAVTFKLAPSAAASSAADKAE